MVVAALVAFAVVTPVLCFCVASGRAFQRVLKFGWGWRFMVGSFRLVLKKLLWR